MLKAIKQELKEQARKAITATRSTDERQSVYFDGTRTWLYGTVLELVSFQGLMKYMKQAGLKLPDPVPYQFRLGKTGEDRQISFQTRAEAMEFGKNLATMFQTEVRMSTGGSGTYATRN